ncbi:MAG: hypothetical protein ACTSXW_07270 [Candidatus Baldrarchaeia archaeon]
MEVPSEALEILKALKKRPLTRRRLRSMFPGSDSTLERLKRMGAIKEITIGGMFSNEVIKLKITRIGISLLKKYGLS